MDGSGAERRHSGESIWTEAYAERGSGVRWIRRAEAASDGKLGDAIHDDHSDRATGGNRSRRSSVVEMLERRSEAGFTEAEVLMSHVP